MPMNPYVSVAWERFKEFFLKASTVESPEVKFGFDEYHDFVMLSKPVIYISVREVCSTHQHLVEHKERIAPNPSDPLHVVLGQLGPPPTVEEFLGECTVCRHTYLYLCGSKFFFSGGRAPKMAKIFIMKLELFLYLMKTFAVKTWYYCNLFHLFCYVRWSTSLL